MGTLWQDIRCGLRMFTNSPDFMALAVLTLAFSIVSETGASEMYDAVFINSLAFADSNQAPLIGNHASKMEKTESDRGKLGKLVAIWKLDEIDGNIAVDSSGNGFAGRLIGNPQWEPTAGKFKGALAFHGAQDSVQINNESAFNITGAITVAAWIKVNSFDKRWQTIVAKGDTAWRLQRTANENTLAFHCTGLSSAKGQWPYGVEGRKDINDGKWHHVAGVYDGGVISLYIDAILDNSVRASGAIQMNSFPVSIGANAEASERNWSGLIDDVCVFAFALNVGGIRALYSGRDPIMIAEQASAIVSEEEVKAESHAEQENDADTPQQHKKKSKKWSLAAMIVVGVALTACVYFQISKHPL